MSAPIPHPHALAGATRPTAPVRRLSLWLAPPEAGDCFDAAQLDEADRQRWLRLNHRRRREDFAVSRALLNHIAPHVSDALSLSHSDSHAAICIGPAGCKVGIDVERHSARDVTAIARFAFHAEEFAALEAAAPSQRERLFYAMWVFKEAAAKALQLDLLDALRRCVLVAYPERWIGRIPTDERWSAWVYEPRPGLSLAAIQVGGEPAYGPACLEWVKGPARWLAVARAGSSCAPSADAGSRPGFVDNHRLADNCCPHRDGGVTGSPQLRRSSPYRNAKPLSSLVKNPAPKN